MRLTYEAILEDRHLLNDVLATARRERAREMHRLIVAPIVNFFADHAPRPRLARQG